MTAVRPPAAARPPARGRCRRDPARRSPRLPRRGRCPRRSLALGRLRSSRGSWVLLLGVQALDPVTADRKSTRLNSSHVKSLYAVFCLKKKREMGGAEHGLRQRNQALASNRQHVPLALPVSIEFRSTPFPRLLTHSSSGNNGADTSPHR